MKSSSGVRGGVALARLGRAETSAFERAPPPLQMILVDLCASRVTEPCDGYIHFWAFDTRPLFPPRYKETTGESSSVSPASLNTAVPE